MADPTLSARQRLHAVVWGDVQGVGYRDFARREALSRGLAGFVRNAADGSVDVIAEGDRRDLESFAIALERGPTAARVERVDREWAAAEGIASGFSIRW